jgi:hypothetical protein
MSAFIESCRRMAAVVSTLVLGIIIASGALVRPASADDVYEFRGQSSAEAPRAASGKKMRLGAFHSQESRESLSGGSRGLSSRRKNAKRAASAKRRRGVQVASLGESYQPKPEVGTSLAGGGVKWVASPGCLNARLKAVIHQVASAFGPVTVMSTCRSRRHNARVGGARHSHHLSGNAVDFRVRGNVRSVYAFLRGHASVGGLKLYRRGFFHIDTGTRRTW